MNSPFRYAGSKYRARNLIVSRLPSHTHFCELFCGGGSIFFHKDKVSSNWLNDANPELINCYTQIRDNIDAVISCACALPITKEDFRRIRDDVGGSDIQQAGRFYYLTRTAYAGIVCKSTWGYSAKEYMRPVNWTKYLRLAHDKLQDVQLTNVDYKKVILDSSWLCYVDPPYYHVKRKFYPFQFEAEEHLHLHSYLAAAKFKWLLSYEDCPEVRELYADYNITAESWMYSIQPQRREMGNELLISNY